MSTLILSNIAPSGIDDDIAVVATSVPYASGAAFASYSNDVFLGGSGMTYDALGRLSGGTITSIALFSYSAALGADADEDASGVSIPVTILLQYIAADQSIVPLLFGASNTISVATSDAYSTSGDNVFNVYGAGAARNQTTVTIGGTGGSDTAVFSSTYGSNDLRSDAALSGGGGNEMMYLHGPAPSADVVLTATMTLIDTLQFVDGSVYEDNASLGAQAALMFEGVFGRLPDPVNAGGFAQVANQSGLVAAATQMMATQEGSSDTIALTNSQFVARLYTDMLHRAADQQGAGAWTQDLDSGKLSRATVTAMFAVGIEAQQVNFAAFATGSGFAADPNAVEVLRAYELLLNRKPEATALIGNTKALDGGGETLQTLYTSIQSSPEFAFESSNQYGISSTTPYATIYSAAHSDPLNGLITSLVTSQGVAHLA
jgi:hypothetical protein